MSLFDTFRNGCCFHEILQVAEISTLEDDMESVAMLEAAEEFNGVADVVALIQQGTVRPAFLVILFHIVAVGVLEGLDDKGIWIATVLVLLWSVCIDAVTQSCTYWFAIVQPIVFGIDTDEGRCRGLAGSELPDDMEWQDRRRTHIFESAESEEWRAEHPLVFVKLVKEFRIR